MTNVDHKQTRTRIKTAYVASVVFRADFVDCDQGEAYLISTWLMLEQRLAQVSNQSLNTLHRVAPETGMMQLIPLYTTSYRQIHVMHMYLLYIVLMCCMLRSTCVKALFCAMSLLRK